ncbi:MAG: DUF2227 family putative metal-binding protein [Chloroflexaceae bacterium]|nr:DUF2227 family putative metal-binding protein [Chloroflexaceae bacterium]NJL33723.1 DUF2227 family putative metal-binding protein [Chloroflexaceae bacterium]
MPGHATHDKIANVAVLAIAPLSFATLRLLGDDPTAAYTGTLIMVGAHLFGSWLLSPDLDLDSAVDDRWGPLRFIWVPYMKLIPHRSFFSHSGFSAVLRLLYLYAAIMIVLLILGGLPSLFGIATIPYHLLFFDWLWGTVRDTTRPAILIVVGVVMSDLVHVLADQLIRSRRRRR